MFIKSREGYLISENLKQAREYLTKKDIPLDSPEFQHIVKSLNNLPNLIDTFTRMVFQGEPGIIPFEINPTILANNITEFDRILNWINDNKSIVSQLPKNITQYKELEELADAIVDLEHDRPIQLFIKSLYLSMRVDINALEGLAKDNFRDIASAFMDLDSETKKQFTPLKHFKINNISTNDFIESLGRFVNGQDINDLKDNTYKYIDDNPDKLDVFYDKDGILIIQTNDGEAVVELGSQKWCIVYALDTYYERYFGPASGNTQYIIYNFNLPASSRYSMFGITINVKGETIHGGSQDKLNVEVELKRIYELLGITYIPEAHLKSMYEEEYKAYLSKLDNLDNLMAEVWHNKHIENPNAADILEAFKKIPYEYILGVRKEATKMGFATSMDLNVGEWLKYYIHIKTPPTLSTEEFNSNIQDINKKFIELDYRIDLGIVKSDFIESKLEKAQLESLPTITELSTQFKYFKEQFRDLGVSENELTLKVLKWFTENIRDDAHENIAIIRELTKYSNGIYTRMSWYLIKYHKEEVDKILSVITKNLETLSKYFIEDKGFIAMLKLRFNVYIDRVPGGVALNDIVYLFYIYIHHIYERSSKMANFERYDEDDDGSNEQNITRYGSHSQLIGNDKITHIPNNRLSGKIILEYMGSLGEIAKRLEALNMTERGTKLTAKEILGDLDDSIPTIIEEFMQMDHKRYSIDIISFEQFKEGYMALKEYLGDDYLTKNGVYIYENYSESAESIEKLVEFMVYLADADDENIYFDVTDLTDEGHIDDEDKVDRDYLEFVGRLILEIKSPQQITDSRNSMELYCVSSVNSDYKDTFYREIGLHYDDKFNVWYIKTDYDELGDYFNEKFDFESFAEDWWFSSGDVSYYSDYITDIDIGNLETIAKYLKVNGFNLDLTPFNKYHNTEDKEIIIRYVDSMMYYREDKELKSLLSTIESIIQEDYDYEEFGYEEDPYDNIDIESIQHMIDRSYERSDNSARESEYFDAQVSIIGDAFLKSWPEEAPSYGNDYFRWSDDNKNILVIPDMDTLLWGDRDDFYSYLSTQDTVSDFTIDTLIAIYFDENGNFTHADDPGYASWGNDEYDYFNEELGNELYELNIEEDIIQESSTILRFDEYIREMKLSELDNPERFISEFGGDEERAKDDLEYYTDTIEGLNSNGGDIYRLVFLEDMSDLNTDDLGEHWCVDSNQLSNFYDSLDDQIGLPYLITAKLESNKVNIEMSYGQYEELPHELEVNLLSDPIKYDIKPYKDTSAAVNRWNNAI
jgi:hypothetical protein